MRKYSTSPSEINQNEKVTKNNDQPKLYQIFKAACKSKDRKEWINVIEKYSSQIRTFTEPDIKFYLQLCLYTNYFNLQIYHKLFPIIIKKIHKVDIFTLMNVIDLCAQVNKEMKVEDILSRALEQIKNKSSNISLSQFGDMLVNLCRSRYYDEWVIKSFTQRLDEQTIQPKMARLIERSVYMLQVSDARLLLRLLEKLNQHPTNIQYSQQELNNPNTQVLSQFLESKNEITQDILSKASIYTLKQVFLTMEYKGPITNNFQMFISELQKRSSELVATDIFQLLNPLITNRRKYGTIIGKPKLLCDFLIDQIYQKYTKFSQREIMIAISYLASIAHYDENLIKSMLNHYQTINEVLRFDEEMRLIESLTILGYYNDEYIHKIMKQVLKPENSRFAIETLRAVVTYENWEIKINKDLFKTILISILENGKIESKTKLNFLGLIKQAILTEKPELWVKELENFGYYESDVQRSIHTQTKLTNILKAYPQYEFQQAKTIDGIRTDFVSLKHKIVVEVDKSTRYFSNIPDRLLPYILFKRRILSKKGYTIIAVPFARENYTELIKEKLNAISSKTIEQA